MSWIDIADSAAGGAAMQQSSVGRRRRSSSCPSVRREAESKHLLLCSGYKETQVRDPEEQASHRIAMK